MNRKLLIAAPAKGGLGTHLFTLMDRLHSFPIPGWDIEWCVESANAILNISRNVLADHAVAGGKNFDRMLMVDTDELITPEHITRILGHDDQRYPIVSALYCMKRPGRPFFLGIRAKGAKPDENQLLEALFLPTGFLSVSVEALRKMQAHHKDKEFYVQEHHALPPGPRPEQKTMWELFPYGVRGPRTAEARLRRVRKHVELVIAKGGVAMASKALIFEAMQNVVTALTDEQPPGNLLGEDFAFSRLATEAGIKQFLDVGCVIPHVGQIAFPITDPAVLATECDEIPECAGDPSTW